MPTKSDEQIKKLDEQIAQLQAQKKTLQNKEKAKLKKERIRRLIKYGELVEKYIGDKPVEEVEKILDSLNIKNH